MAKRDIHAPARPAADKAPEPATTTLPARRRDRGIAMVPPKTSPGRALKVRALETGYYNHKRQREGDVFLIRGDRYAEDVTHPKGGLLRHRGDLVDFSVNWMELVDASVPEHTTPSDQALASETARIADEKRGEAEAEKSALRGTGDREVV